MSKKIIVDGIDFTHFSEFDFKLTFEQTDDRADSVKFIDRIKFFGDAFTYLNSIYFIDKKIDHVCNVIVSGCCDYDFDLKIDYRGVKLDGCFIEATPITKVSSQYDELKKTIWFSNGFTEKNKNFRVPYCSGFSFSNIIFMLLWFVIKPIVQILNALPDWAGGTDIDINELSNKVHGCGYYHIGYSLKEVLEYQCDYLNLKFESSILQSSIYSNLVFVPCASGKGFGKDQDENFDFANAPNYSVLQLLEIFKPVFNATYWIEEDVLYFERNDKYLDVQEVVLDLDIDDYKGGTSFEFSRDSGYAYGRYEYGVDAADQEGGDLSFLHNDLVEWNSPPQEWQKGIKENVLRDFTPATYMQALGSTKLVDNLRFELSGGALGGAYKDMILPNGISTGMKLIIADLENSWLGKNWVKVQNKPVPGTDKYIYNYSLYFNENQYEPELYQQFHYIDDPRSWIDIVGSDIEFFPENFCNFVEIIDKVGVRVGIKSMYGIGIAEGIELDLEFGLVKIKKPVWRCPLVQ